MISSASTPEPTILHSSKTDSVPSSPDHPSFPRRKSSTVDITGHTHTDTHTHTHTKLSVSVVVHVNDNVADKDCLDVTKYVWNRVSAAVGEGEVTISVKRGWEGMEVS
jgi:hypothetical protein